MSENQQLIRHPGDISTVIDKDRRKTAIETRLSPMIAASRTRQREQTMIGISTSMQFGKPCADTESGFAFVP